MENVCARYFKEDKWAPGAVYACQLEEGTKECCQLEKKKVEMPADQIKQLKEKFL